MPANFNNAFAASLLHALHDESAATITDLNPGFDARPTPEQKELALRLGKIVDSRALEIKISPEVLAPRGELKALALGRRDTDALSGWRRREIGERLLAVLPP